MTGSAGAAGDPWWRPPPGGPRRLIERLLRGRLAQDIALLQVSNSVIKGYGFVFSVLVIRLLGAVGYGEFLLVLSLYQTINLLGNLGLGQFLVVPTAQAAAAGDRETVAEATGYNLKLSGTVAVLVVVATLAAAPWLGAAWYGREDIGSLARIAALGALPSVLYNLAVTSLQATRRMGDLALVENVDAVAGRSFGLLAVFAGWGVAGLMLGMALGSVVSAAHGLYQYRRVAVKREGFPDLVALVLAARRVPLKRYFRFSFLAVADKNVGQFFGQTPVLFLGRWGGPEQVAFLNVSAKVFTILAAFHGAVSRAFSVRLSQERGSGSRDSLRRLFWRTSLAWGAISCLIAGLLFLSLPLFRLIYGAANIPSTLLVALLGLLMAKQGFTVSLGAIYLIMDHVLLNALVKLPLMLVWLPLGAVLVQNAGAEGAVGYQLGAYLTGDVIYFGLLLTPWFWRAHRLRTVA